MAQCLEAAARGEEFQVPPSQVKSRRTTQAAVEQDPLVDTSDGVHYLQQMLRQDSADQMGVRLCPSLGPSCWIGHSKQPSSTTGGPAAVGWHLLGPVSRVHGIWTARTPVSDGWHGDGGQP